MLLKVLRDRGIALGLDRGKLTVAASAMLSDGVAAACKASLVELLQAEAAQRLVLA